MKSLLRTAFIFVLALVLTVSHITLVRAQSHTITQDDINSILQGTEYYDPNDECSVTGTPSPGGGGTGNGTTYVLGDSISYGLFQDGIEQKIGGTTKVNYDGGRSITGAGSQVHQSALDAVTADKDFIHSAGTIVIVLGTNQTDDPFGDNQRILLDKLRQADWAPNARYFWVDIGATAPDQIAGWSARNKTIYENATGLNYKVISRYKAIFGQDKDPLNLQPLAMPGSSDNVHGSYPPLTEAIVNALGSTGATPSAPSAPSTPSTSFSPDPEAVKMYQENLKPLIDPLAPLYQKAAQNVGLADWEILPALHNLEFGLQRTNPTSNLGFKTPFQMNGDSLARAGVDLSQPMFQPGHELTDDEFVTVAGYAAKLWLLSDAKALGIDATKPVQAADAAKMIVAYKSGAGSVWFTGKADFNLHAYAWAGFDTTPQHKLPMPWGPGSPFGDEVAGTTVNKVGAATLFMLLKGGSFGTGSSNGCGSSKSGSVGTFTPITGSREELVARILGSPNLKLGNSGNAASQKDDITNNVTLNTLAGLAAILEQSGVPILMNAIKSDHGAGGDHGAGQALDIGYYGNGTPEHKAEGDTLYKFLYDNRDGLKVGQMIWKMPPDGYQCANDGQPTDCYTFYGSETMGQHYHHIHVSFKP